MKIWCFQKSPFQSFYNAEQHKEMCACYIYDDKYPPLQERAGTFRKYLTTLKTKLGLFHPFVNFSMKMGGGLTLGVGAIKAVFVVKVEI